MRIAVTYESQTGNIFQHFGHTEAFKIYDVEDGKILSSQVVGTNGSGHGALAGFLQGGGVNVLICGGIGMGAQNALAQAGVQLFGGVSGPADAAVEALVAGTLLYNPDVQCNHHGHGHEHGHNCGGHGHGQGGCGSHGGSCHN
ncbi:MAG: NifB/NifX family molybdenum-iron cluster-binding protein [Ruminiclostridium sp.]|nr:NifB/NifX family molybdenum-iron cluster-binding protein [Ruminiclostridium sp.]